jgi:hypothetical protein
MAPITSANPAVAAVDKFTCKPVGDGTTELVVTFAGQTQKVPVKVTCPATATTGCIGSVRVSVGKKAVTKSATYRLGSGGSTVVKAKVTAKGKKALKPGRKTKVTATLTPVGAKKPSATVTFKVVRK